MLQGLLKYDVKVLMALKESIGGSKQFFEWLATSGYPELAAFSNFLQDDIEAEQWLVQHRYHWLGILSHAIDGDPRSRKWMHEKMHPANLMFALSCTGDEKALSWLKFMHLDILLILAKEVSQLRQKQEMDTVFPYKMRF